MVNEKLVEKLQDEEFVDKLARCKSKEEARKLYEFEGISLDDEEFSDLRKLVTSRIAKIQVQEVDQKKAGEVAGGVDVGSSSAVVPPESVDLLATKIT